MDECAQRGGTTWGARRRRPILCTRAARAQHSACMPVRSDLPALSASTRSVRRGVPECCALDRALRLARRWTTRALAVLRARSVHTQHATSTSFWRLGAAPHGDGAATVELAAVSRSAEPAAPQLQARSRGQHTRKMQNTLVLSPMAPCGAGPCHARSERGTNRRAVHAISGARTELRIVGRSTAATARSKRRARGPWPHAQCLKVQARGAVVGASAGGASAGSGGGPRLGCPESDSATPSCAPTGSAGKLRQTRTVSNVAPAECAKLPASASVWLTMAARRPATRIRVAPALPGGTAPASRAPVRARPRPDCCTCHAIDTPQELSTSLRRCTLRPATPLALEGVVRPEQTPYTLRGVLWSVAGGFYRACFAIGSTRVAVAPPRPRGRAAATAHARGSAVTPAARRCDRPARRARARRAARFARSDDDDVASPEAPAPCPASAPNCSASWCESRFTPTHLATHTGPPPLAPARTSQRWRASCVPV